MNRNTNGSRLICDRARDRLANPPCRIGTKLIALLIIKLLHCLDQSEVTLLDQVKEQHSTSYITFGDTYYQTKVCLRKLLLGFGISLLHALCKLYLFIR